MRRLSLISAVKSGHPCPALAPENLQTPPCVVPAVQSRASGRVEFWLPLQASPMTSDVFLGLSENCFLTSKMRIIIWYLRVYED